MQGPRMERHAARHLGLRTGLHGLEVNLEALYVALVALILKCLATWNAPSPSVVGPCKSSVFFIL